MRVSGLVWSGPVPRGGREGGRLWSGWARLEAVDRPVPKVGSVALVSAAVSVTVVDVILGMESSTTTLFWGVCSSCASSLPFLSPRPWSWPGQRWLCLSIRGSGLASGIFSVGPVVACLVVRIHYYPPGTGVFAGAFAVGSLRWGR